LVILIGAAGSSLIGCRALSRKEPASAASLNTLEAGSVTVFHPTAFEDVDEGPPWTSGARSPNPVRGRELFATLGCADCHGEHGEGMGAGVGSAEREGEEHGMIVPTLAQTPLSLERFIAQVRHPHEYMRPYSVRDVGDADLADIYAYLQTLPRPATVVPSVLSQVPPAPTGTLRGTVYYQGTHTPVPNFGLYLVAAEPIDGKFRYVYETWFQPSTITNADGTFEMPLIREGYYVLFESRKMEEVRSQNGKVAVVQVRAGQITEVGVFVSK